MIYKQLRLWAATKMKSATPTGMALFIFWCNEGDPKRAPASYTCQGVEAGRNVPVARCISESRIPSNGQPLDGVAVGFSACGGEENPRRNVCRWTVALAKINLFALVAPAAAQRQPLHSLSKNTLTNELCYEYNTVVEGNAKTGWRA